jgi:hypothetical protein
MEFELTHIRVSCLGGYSTGLELGEGAVPLLRLLNCDAQSQSDGWIVTMQPEMGVLNRLSQTKYGLHVGKYMSMTGTLRGLEPSAHLPQML